MGYIPQLFGLTILPLTLLLLVIVFSSVAVHQKAMRDMAGEQALRTVRASASSLGEQVQHNIDSLRVLAQRAADGAEAQMILDSSEYLRGDFNAGLAFYSLSGQPVAGVRPDHSPTQPGREIQSLLEDLPGPQSPNPVAWRIWKNTATGETVANLAAAAGPDRALVGSFYPDRLARQLLSATYGAHTSGGHLSIFLVDPTLQPLYVSDPAAPVQELGSQPGIAEGLRGESGITYLELDGIEHVVAFSPVPPLGWALAIEEPWEATASPLLRTSQVAPLVLVPALLLALVGLWFGARQIIQPLQTLESQANDLAWGRFTAVQQPVGGIEEIQRLQLTLREMARKVQAAQENLHSYIGAITAGQEDERRRLAREIHDDTLQAVIALNQRVQLARLSLGEHPATGSLAEVQELTEQTIRNLRRLLRALRPAYLDELGLAASLEMLARETGQSGEIPIEFISQGEERRLPAEMELTLYRMAQEALNNLVRHAQATRGWLEIGYLEGKIELTIRDNGCGFRVPENPGEFAPAGHFGLLGLHERAELIGAQLSLESSPGNGTSVRIRLPVSN